MNKTQVKHTETPWKTDNFKYFEGLNTRIIAGKEGDETYIGLIEGNNDSDKINEANAEFIVRCCNAHEKLVEALQIAFDLIDGNDGALALPEEVKQIKQALAQAKGE